MTINISAVGMELTPAIRSYTEDKFSSLEKFEGSIMHIDIDIGMETHHHHKGEIFTCSATLQLPKDVLKVEKKEEDLYKAIDKVKDHLREILVEKKERVRDDHRRNTGKTEEM